MIDRTDTRRRGRLLGCLLLAALAACGDTAPSHDPVRSPVTSDSPLSVPVPVPVPVAPRATAPKPLALQPLAFEEREIAKPNGPAVLVVSVRKQSLVLLRGGVAERDWPVSTAVRGVGNTAGSYRTPLGHHRIAHVFGAGAPPGTIFEARRSTGRIATITTDATDSDDDQVTTRVLWLEGLEPGVNRGPGIDSKQRLIYIHGTPEEGLIGRPASHGCVRMKNADVVELFELVGVGTLVNIIE